MLNLRGYILDSAPLATLRCAPLGVIPEVVIECAPPSGLGGGQAPALRIGGSKREGGGSR